MMRRAVVLFTGDARREEMQKRLPARFLSALHREMIETVCRSSDVSLIVASETGGRFRLTFGDARAAVDSERLGEKVGCAYRFAFDLGFDSVVLLAGDIAGIEPADIDGAFAMLEGTGRRCVLGPAGDGGFYLLGLNRASGSRGAIDWNALPWFTNSCGDALASAVRGIGCQIFFIRRIDDVDSYSDAVRVTGRLPPRFARLRNRLRGLLSAPGVALIPRGDVQQPHLFSCSLLRAPPSF